MDTKVDPLRNRVVKVITIMTMLVAFTLAARATIDVSWIDKAKVVQSAKLKQDLQDLQSQIDSLKSPLVPAGTVMAYAGTSATPPAGWLFCNGATKNSADYPALYQAIGTHYGSGDASPGSFSIPDYRGLFLRGRDDGSGKDPDHGARTASVPGGDPEAVGSFEGDGLSLHSHTYSSGASAGQCPALTQNCGSTFITTTNGTGGSENRPKNVYVSWIIKY